MGITVIDKLKSILQNNTVAVVADELNCSTQAIDSWKAGINHPRSVFSRRIHRLFTRKDNISSNKYNDHFSKKLRASVQYLTNILSKQFISSTTGLGSAGISQIINSHPDRGLPIFSMLNAIKLSHYHSRNQMHQYSMMNINEAKDLISLSIGELEQKGVTHIQIAKAVKVLPESVILWRNKYDIMTRKYVPNFMKLLKKHSISHLDMWKKWNIKRS